MSKNTLLIYGIHSVNHLLQSNPQQVLGMYLVQGKINDSRCNKLLQMAAEHKIAVHPINKSKLDDWSAGAAHQGVAAIIKPSELLTEEKLFALVKQGLAEQQPPLLLILDGIQDPHNLGAILRTADAAGVTAVVLPKVRSVGITSTVRKVASGAADTVPLVSVSNLARTLTALQELGVWLVGMDCAADAASLYATDLTGAKGIILGGEGSGLRGLTRKNCDFIAAIPMLGSIESLNVSVAAGVCLFEAVRQRSSAH